MAGSESSSVLFAFIRQFVYVATIRINLSFSFPPREKSFRERSQRTSADVDSKRPVAREIWSAYLIDRPPIV